MRVDPLGQGTLFGYLWLIDYDQSLSPAELELAARSAGELGAAMYRTQEREEPRRELEHKLVSALLDGRAGAAHELLAADLLAPQTPITVLVVKPYCGAGDELAAAQKASLGLA